ncbi:LOW QUALITY PROTEIN: lipase maturation factor 2 [Lepeophtheirus salmonis]|uniref:LOW QUALITY PROTEIN: lipase maturation factor 2 n=1 Tax=Lepeophtheirus salmonis TaxID=72036 RepID=UPI001AE38FE5|nr:LOW QUALITY PROTEIN: lipase maturation factor 2-like [Lepeophtheirus salmonis]
MWIRPRSLTRSLFLRLVASCYAMAFTSLYIQIPGLYGKNGVSPVHKNNDGRSDSFWDRPTLVWLVVDLLGISHEHSLDLMCIVGTLISCVSIFVRGFLGGKMGFLLNWILYLSLYQVGGRFLWFQWDILLLEVGFLCILVAPFREDGKSRPWDRLNMECVRWLLFRMMFANGLVKLTSECPSWWNLTAMPLHYESQCIPTPASWFTFNLLPESFHKFSVAWTFMIEIPMTFLFYAPTVGLRRFSYSQQIFLMIIIMVTGNYNFFNFLFMALCISLSDDSWWNKALRTKRHFLVRFVFSCFNISVILSLVTGFVYYFMNDKYEFEIQFKLKELKHFIAITTSFGIAVAAFFFLFFLFWMIILIINSLKQGFFTFLQNLYWGSIYGLMAAGIFIKSVPVFVGGLDGAIMPPIIAQMDTTILDRLDSFHLVNSYGLFRRMTGVGGRPEVVILGSDDRQNWEEYQFLYKPGNITAMPRYVLPHQPRLDWQMWFIALQGKFNLDRWFVTMCHRFLQGQRTVLDLLDRRNNPFDKRAPPKYLKAHLYHYHFTTSSEDITKQWWTRELIDPEFINIIDEPTIKNYLDKIDSSPQVTEMRTNQSLKKSLNWLRVRTNEFEPHIVVWTLSMLYLPVISKIVFGWIRIF